MNSSCAFPALTGQNVSLGNGLFLTVGLTRKLLSVRHFSNPQMSHPAPKEKANDCSQKQDSVCDLQWQVSAPHWFKADLSRRWAQKGSSECSWHNPTLHFNPLTAYRTHFHNINTPTVVLYYCVRPFKLLASLAPKWTRTEYHLQESKTSILVVNNNKHGSCCITVQQVTRPKASGAEGCVGDSLGRR